MNKIIVEEKTLSDRITCCNERHNVTVVQDTIKCRLYYFYISCQNYHSASFKLKMSCYVNYLLYSGFTKQLALADFTFDNY